MSGTTLNTNSTSSAPVVRAIISDLAAYIYSNLGSINSANDVESIINAYQASVSQPSVNLSSISPDFEANQQMLMYLFQQTEPWKDDIKTGVGTAIVRALATMQTYSTYNIVRSAQETILPFATLPSSIYAGTAHLGVRVSRSTPCSMSATLTYSGTSFPFTIPAYSAFTVNGDSYFNRSSIIFTDSTTVTLSVTLYQGTVNTISYTATGESYQTYTFGNSDYAISDSDLYVTVGGVSYTRAAFNTIFSTGLWKYTSIDKVFLDNTTPDGNVTISFGNGSYGVVPPAGETLSIMYCTTNGTAGAASYSGYNIASGYSANVTGIVTSASAGGGDPLSPYDYKNLSPGSYSSKGSGITSDGLNSVVRSYAGVADARVLTQQDFAPNDLTKMMQARVVILPSTNWTSDNYLEFYTWLQGSCIANMQFTNVDPTAVLMNVTATIYCFTQADLDDVETKAKAALINAFQPTRGTLGYTWTLNDIYDLIKNSTSDYIDYVDLFAPTTDQVPVDGTHYIKLGTLSITASYTAREKLGNGE